MTDTGERPDSDAVAALMAGGRPLSDERLLLGLDGCTLALRSNSSALIAELRDYFGAQVIDDGEADIDVIAIERPALDLEESLGVEFVDWAREPGKQGRKDAYVELTDGRLVLKVRTGLVFLQRDGDVIAAGPCRQHPNQVINFVNAQYMNRLQQQGCRSVDRERTSHRLRRLLRRREVDADAASDGAAGRRLHHQRPAVRSPPG